MKVRVHEIVSQIPEGRERGVSRKELARLCGVEDRAMRKLLEIARCDGVPIINLQDGHGYYISYDIVDLKAQYMQNNSRIRVLTTQTMHLARLLKAAGVKI